MSEDHRPPVDQPGPSKPPRTATVPKNQLPAEDSELLGPSSQASQRSVRIAAKVLLPLVWAQIGASIDVGPLLVFSTPHRHASL